MNNNKDNQALSTVHKIQNGGQREILDGLKRFAALIKPIFLFGSLLPLYEWKIIVFYLRGQEPKRDIHN